VDFGLLKLDDGIEQIDLKKDFKAIAFLLKEDLVWFEGNQKTLNLQEHHHMSQSLFQTRFCPLFQPHPEKHRLFWRFSLIPLAGAGWHGKSRLFLKN